MQYFYDGQVRRYLVQTVRVLSNFVVKYGDGSLHRVPVMYGDSDKQAATIARQNSENKVNSAPRISIYISALDIDHSRLSDSSYVGKVHVREREIEGDAYNNNQGRNYTVERLMPTPFKLTMKCDIWTTSTEQKLQLLEQILVLFNPSLELQTSDNYLDWTSLSVLNLASVIWSSRSVPQGTTDQIDIATLTFETPIWISPPAKVKHLGVITKIITSLYDTANTDSNAYIDGLGLPLTNPETTMSGLLAREMVTITDYNIQVYNNQVILLHKSESTNPDETRAQLDIPVRQGTAINWIEVLDKYPGKYVAGSSTIYLTQPNGTEVVGTVAINPLDDSILTVTWDTDTRPSDILIDSQGYFDTDPSHYGLTGTQYRSRSPGTFDAIIDPTKIYPGNGMNSVVSGDRFLIVEDIGDTENQDGPDAWKSTGGDDFYAKANDIIEWQDDHWVVIFNASQESDTLLYQTNIYTGVQYVWNGIYWGKSFEGEYRAGEWRLEL